MRATLKIHEEREGQRTSWMMFPPDEMLFFQIGIGEYEVARNSQGWVALRDAHAAKAYVDAQDILIAGLSDYPEGVTVRVDDPYRLVVTTGMDELFAPEALELALESGYPSGPISEQRFSQRSVYLVPGTWLEGATRDLLVDKETGVILGVRGADGSIAAELVDFRLNTEPEAECFEPRGTVVGMDEEPACLQQHSGLSSISRVWFEDQQLFVGSDATQETWEVDWAGGAVNRIPCDLDSPIDAAVIVSNEDAAKVSNEDSNDVVIHHPRGGEIIGRQEWVENETGGSGHYRLYWNRPQPRGCLLVDQGSEPTSRAPSLVILGETVFSCTDKAISVFGMDMELNRRIPYRALWANVAGTWLVSTAFGGHGNDVDTQWKLDIWDTEGMEIVTSLPVKSQAPNVVSDRSGALWIPDGDLRRAERLPGGDWKIEDVIVDGKLVTAQAPT